MECFGVIGKLKYSMHIPTVCYVSMSLWFCLQYQLVHFFFLFI